MMESKLHVKLVSFSRSQVAIKLVERSSVAEVFEVREVFI